MAEVFEVPVHGRDATGPTPPRAARARRRGCRPAPGGAPHAPTSAVTIPPPHKLQTMSAMVSPVADSGAEAAAPVDWQRSPAGRGRPAASAALLGIGAPLITDALPIGGMCSLAGRAIHTSRRAVSEVEPLIIEAIIMRKHSLQRHARSLTLQGKASSLSASGGRTFPSGDSEPLASISRARVAIVTLSKHAADIVPHTWNRPDATAEAPIIHVLAAQQASPASYPPEELARETDQVEKCRGRCVVSWRWCDGAGRPVLSSEVGECRVARPRGLSPAAARALASWTPAPWTHCEPPGRGCETSRSSLRRIELTFSASSGHSVTASALRHFETFAASAIQRRRGRGPRPPIAIERRARRPSVTASVHDSNS
ncbi:hypothetical protein K1T71_013419 [Dendrolimus kikuchii]|uniref:Uncharacterized protein n=1 Tax=Dendrolimus kikuchii TaxID=765133 RepID=A0ACC1CI64_9NEOP|nr:hypothetical protein K1T71_013419 [Dendrolimus kikuchii]